jgi:hypothetical protein
LHVSHFRITSMIVFMWKSVWVGLHWQENSIKDKTGLEILSWYICHENSINNSYYVACFYLVFDLVLSYVSVNISGMCMKANICSYCGRYS